MNKKINFVILIVVAISITISCKKDRIEKKEKNEYAPVNTYLDSKKQQEQDFVITGPSNDTIVGNQGTKLLAGKDCLMFPNGDTVGYPFTVKLVELYTPKDMIYWQIPTVASGNILETDGEIRVRAVKDGQDLVLRPSCFYRVMMPNSAPSSNMREFLGFDGGGFIDWTDNPANLSVTTTVSPIFSTDAYGYVGDVPRLGWLNCGVLANNSSGSTITFTSETDNLQNVGTFVYFPATKSVMQAYNSVTGLIPNGTSIKIILIGMQSSGALFYFYKDTNISVSTTIDVEMTSISDADLTTLLNSL
ncbi:MAG: hypothetical protein A3K10_01895 [Bacteroidetes bacterium RIFCSPLOWO2_12_FULL_31_6]|nr:MAG: hypothetical protein A3K10_01895 [Bacteroidetes bacterium RIFCSPLOWO2_12_FULL_31_6]